MKSLILMNNTTRKQQSVVVPIMQQHIRLRCRKHLLVKVADTKQRTHTAFGYTFLWIYNCKRLIQSRNNNNNNNSDLFLTA